MESSFRFRVLKKLTGVAFVLALFANRPSYAQGLRPPGFPAATAPGAPDGIPVATFGVGPSSSASSPQVAAAQPQPSAPPGPSMGTSIAPSPASYTANQQGAGEAGSAAVAGGYGNFANRTGSTPRQAVYRLASVPHMYGDVFSPSATITASGFNAVNGGIVADVPLAGGSRRIKIGENNAALPVDRLSLMYNHFTNALELDANGLAPGTEKFPVDRYTLGFEKTFWCGDASVELRLPLNSEFDRAIGGGAIPFNIDGGSLGNLAVVTKFVLARTEMGVLATGLGFDVPTGDDVQGMIDGQPFTIENDSLHLLPWLGVSFQPSENWFYHAFVQLDFATSGNNVIFDDGLGGGAVSIGRFNEQNLLHADLAIGRWLYRCGEECDTMGIAATMELHYTSTLQDSDVVDSGGVPGIILNNNLNRFDIFNFTAGLHTTMGMTDMRIGVVVPLRDAPDRFFDTELQAQLNRRF